MKDIEQHLAVIKDDETLHDHVSLNHICSGIFSSWGDCSGGWIRNHLADETRELLQMKMSIEVMNDEE